MIYFRSSVEECFLTVHFGLLVALCGYSPECLLSGVKRTIYELVEGAIGLLATEEALDIRQ
jgi:hypothetical protein